MGAVGGFLGLNGGANGTGFAGPAQANITNPTNQQQLSQAYTGAQNSLQSQQSLLQALQGQNALGNQNQVYGQLQGIANGTGPNPAMAQLNQTTGQNVANTAALMAGQRGAAQNVGLLARQAGQAGANVQQQAVGQGATLAANQELNAINSAGSMANNQASNLVGQTNANTQAQQAEQQALLNAQTAYNTSQVSNQAGVNSANASLANTAMGAQQGMIGGLMNGVGTALGADGGEIRMMADGGNAFSGPQTQSKFGKFLNGFSNTFAVPDQTQGSAPLSDTQQLQQGTSNFTKGLINALTPSAPAPTTIAGGPMDQGSPSQNVMQAAKGGQVPALLSPGETYLPPNKVNEVVKEGKDPIKEGKKVPGNPKYPGNDYRNDVVPAKLEEGGIVIPNKIMQSADPAHESYKFVQKIVANRKVKGRHGRH